MSSVPFIDLKTQYKALKESIDSRIMKVLESGAYVNGPEVAELEQKLAAHTGVKHTLACASGTDALLIPLMALGIGPGDEVITSAFSFIASAEVIVLAGAKPIFVDIQKDTFNIDPKAIERAITPKTKAIMPVSLYGQMADMDEIMNLAAQHKIPVVEDLAQSYGAKYKNKRSGSMAIASGTSFYPAKPLGCYGDGGAIFTNDDKLAVIMKEIREHGSEKRYYHTRVGVNGRLDTIQCAILLAKMERYDWEIEQRQKVANRYNNAFKEIKAEGFSFPIVKSDRDSVWAQYTLTVKDRPGFQKKLQDKGVPTSVHYPLTMADQPWYKQHAGGAQAQIPTARWAADNVVSLPLYPDMDTATQDRVIEAVLTALK
jgi:UDP-2-acetamido-2-deoxy-ribo-hexuluronate aminotransferase